MRRVTATKLPPAAEWPPGASLLVTTVSVAWTDGSDECHGDDLNVPSGGPWPGPPKRSQSFKFVGVAAGAGIQVSHDSRVSHDLSHFNQISRAVPA